MCSLGVIASEPAFLWTHLHRYPDIFRFPSQKLGVGVFRARWLFIYLALHGVHGKRAGERSLKCDRKVFFVIVPIHMVFVSSDSSVLRWGSKSGFRVVVT
jgi:hypothetical protein